MSVAANIVNKKCMRSFRVIYLDVTGHPVMRGRFCSIKPYYAARKALTSIYDLYMEHNLKIPDDFKIGLYETTRHSKNNHYWYMARIKILDEPSIRLVAHARGGTIIMRELKQRCIPIIKSIPAHQCNYLLNYKLIQMDDDSCDSKSSLPFEK